MTIGEDLKERSHFRRMATLGVQAKGYFPADPEALLLNDALFEYVHNGVQLPSWYASALLDPSVFDGEHIGVLKRLKALATPTPITESEEDRQVWERYRNWCFDTSGELIGDDERTPRERLSEYFSEEEIEFEWKEIEE